MFMGRQGSTGVSVEIVRGGKVLTEFPAFDIELQSLLDKAELWIDALKGPARILVEEAESGERDGAVAALQVATGHVNAALKALIEAVYERNIT